ncbi:P-loop NTPase [Endothiovibrio diazotrophicus]
METRIINVQSAKGGVGKTLLSLLLANRLRTKEETFAAVVVDLDFTGTSVSDLIYPQQSKEGSARLHGVPLRTLTGISSGKPRLVTLADLYGDYLNGQELEHSLSERIGHRGLFRNPCKSSGNGDDRPVLHLASGASDGPGLVPDAGSRASPSTADLLYDHNRARWLVDFLFELFDRFAERLGASDVEPVNRQGRYLYFILDNAPGQSSLQLLLQEKLLRWGRHRAKFLQVASLDEMDIRSSLDVLAHLHRRGEIIHRTKGAIADRADPSTLFACYGQPAGDRPAIDHDYLLELLSDDPDKAVEIARKEYALEQRVCRYTALVLNRVFETVDRGRVDALIFEHAQQEQDGRTLKEANGLRDLARLTFPYDPALALIFQERFRAVDAPADTGEPPPSKAAEGKGCDPAAWQETPREEGDTAAVGSPYMYRLADLERRLYDGVYGRRTRLDFNTPARFIARVIPFEAISPVWRVSHCILRLLELAHRLLLAIDPDQLFLPAEGIKFRAVVLRTLIDRWEEELPDSSQRNLWEEIQEPRFVAECLSQQELAGDRPGLTSAGISDFRLIVDEAESSGRDTPMCQALMDLFPLYGLRVAFFGALDKNGQLTDGTQEPFRQLLLLALEIIEAVQGGTSAERLCTTLERRFPQGRGEEVHRFHLELADVVEELRLFDRSVATAEAAGSLLLEVSSTRIDGIRPLTPLAQLYLQTSITALFQGRRGDARQVRIEVRNLLAGHHASAPPDLAGSLEQRLGGVLSELFSRGSCHGDH